MAEPQLSVQPPAAEANDMLDLIMIGIGLGFFGLMVGYIAACDRV